jgi:hypothetical protein
MLVRVVLVLGLQALLCLAAPARDLEPDLNALFEGFYAHRRVASAYLRTHNIELGAAEIERLRKRWAGERRGLSPATAADASLATALVQTETLLAESLKAADAGDAERARVLLEEAALPLDEWRRANGIRLFSDCIAEVTAAYRRLDVYRQRPPDLNDRATAERVATLANDTVTALSQCEREAGEAVRRQAEFRRLIDGMLASLRQVPQALAARDGAHLYRLLIEQRSLERLLSFRFG